MVGIAGMDQERMRLSREEDLYKQEMLRLEKDLGDLEATVEELRGNVINRKTRVNMSDVENMALVLSKSSKTVADLKLRWVLTVVRGRPKLRVVVFVDFRAFKME